MAGPAAGRPLRGKSFYLDVPSGRAARDLAAAIRHLGGVTESFLSKEVNYVVSSNKEAKRDKARTRTEKRSNTTSGDAKAKSPVPSTSKGNHTKLQQKPPDAALISRGKELLQKAMKNQDTCSGSSILANARLWGVQILHVDEMLLYAQQLLRAISGSRKQSQKIEAKCLASGSKIRKGKLKPPFLKVEDQSRQFRPFHHQFKSFPDLNFLAPKSSSPFEPLKSLSNSCRARGAEGCPMHSNQEKSPQSTPVTVPKKKRGFCECCRETFEELQKHLQSPQHKRFALDDSRYASVDHVISQLTNDFVEQPAKVPPSCLTDEHLMPRAQVTGGIEKLTAELGKESQQPEHGAADLFVDAEPDPGLKTKEWSPCLPRDNVSNPREAGGLSENSLGLSVGAGLTAGVCTACGTAEDFAVVGDTDSDLAPELGWGTCVAASHVGGAIASSSEPHKQQVLGSVSHLPQALPVTRKRQLSSSQSTQVGKKPRLELGGGCPLKQASPVGGGVGVQGAGQAPEPGLPGVEAGTWPLSTKISTRPHCPPVLDLCLRGNPGDPVSQPGSLEALSVGFDPTETAAASTVSKHGWSRGSMSSHGKLGGENGNTPRNVHSPALESTMSKSSCPAGQSPSPKLPLAEARCCCSLCVKTGEKIAPELPSLPSHSKEQTPCPRLLQHLPCSTQADDDFRKSSSESDWDVQLLSTLTGVQDSRIQSVDRDLLQRTHVNVRDSGYESQLCSVLKQNSEFEWAAKGDKSCRNCCTDTKEASHPIFETFFWQLDKIKPPPGTSLVP
ncbi:protein DBF4 homolog B isoform X2 [Oxyura jamaicensis]|uniref:protein DBF4 homolog B isoform X2 n=1 Tax=Oxyura jamaicensis TaxID=8884 RepID=UPI0015A5A2C8|nr:protein DBF4 homolog B isoform X2 [Oxyura jamaicensis]